MISQYWNNIALVAPLVTRSRIYVYPEFLLTDSRLGLKLILPPRSINSKDGAAYC